MVIPSKSAPLTSKGSSSRRRDIMGVRNPWKTLELTALLIYAAGFYFLVIRRSLELAADFSTGNNSGKLRGLRLDKYWNRLSDTSDSQWRSFRDNLPILTVVMAVFLLSGNAIRKYFSLGGKGMPRVLLVFSLAYILYLHGACFVFLLVIITSNYIAVKMLAGRPMFPAFIWLYNLFFLVNNRVFEGYSFSLFGKNYAYLDNYRGVQRWHICFNFVMLRMVSFGLDYHWARLSKQSTVNLEKHLASCSLCSSGSTCYLIRQETSLSLSSYCPETYFSYLFYPPLYIAGPIISFNAFASQMECPQKHYKKLDIFVYGLRWISCLALMEALTHYFYYNSLSTSGIWQALSPWEIFAVGYGVLNFMWLKFLLIWRYFRFWALVGGVEVVENMPTCINNCYDIEGFWKSWHASYNRWLVRYLYVPLGGSRWRLLNIWVVFTFVAVWHDLEWKLLSWAWVTCLIMVPELSVKSLMRTNAMKPLRESAIYRELCAIGGAVTISGLMTANLIGFVVGPDRMHWLLQAMVEPQNILTTVGILFSFYIGTKLMFHVRELRAHHNVANKQAD